MSIAQDLATQKKDAVAQQRRTEQLITKEKDLLRQEIAALDRQITTLHAQRTRAAADLAKFG
jgi:uncharacterized protein YlxW (UPF0749 family)